MIPRVVRAFADNSLGLYASAIAFQLLTSLIPLALLAFGIAGFLSLQDVWSRELSQPLAERITPSAYELINGTVQDVLGSKRVLWVTLGAALAVWQLSGAVRASMSALDRIYGAEDDRPFWQRMRRSAWLAAAGAALVFAAIAVIAGSPLALGDPGGVVAVLLFVARWALGGALLLLAVGLLVHFGPARPRPVGWTSVGSLLVVGLWALTSIGFAVYLSLIAGGSLFGHLVTIVVGIGYLYGASLAFLIGAQVDALLRDRAGEPRDRPRRGSSGRSRRSSRRAVRT